MWFIPLFVNHPYLSWIGTSTSIHIMHVYIHIMHIIDTDNIQTDNIPEHCNQTAWHDAWLLGMPATQSCLCHHNNADAMDVIIAYSPYSSSSPFCPARLRAFRPGRPVGPYGLVCEKSMCFSASVRTMNDGTFTSCLPTRMWRWRIKTRAWWTDLNKN